MIQRNYSKIESRHRVQCMHIIPRVNPGNANQLVGRMQLLHGCNDAGSDDSCLVNGVSVRGEDVFAVDVLAEEWCVGVELGGAGKHVPDGFGDAVRTAGYGFWKKRMVVGFR